MRTEVMTRQWRLGRGSMRRGLLVLGLTASLAAGLLLSAPQGWAEEAEEDPFDGRLLPVELVMAFRRQVDLSAEQNAAIGELVVELQKEVAERQWQMQSAYFDLLEVLDQPTIDEDRALALARQAVTVENEIKLAQMRLLIRLRNLLEPDQIAYLRERLDAGWEDE